MEFEAVPPVAASEQRALIEALERSGALIDDAPGAYESAWRAASLREAGEPDEHEDYVLSPRSTRGATRA